MYEAVADPYCYRNSSVLKNRLRYRAQSDLEKFEKAMVAMRSEEPLPIGRLSYRYYRAIHRHFFQDVYRWAGRIRTVRISKDKSPFCFPENIEREMHYLFDTLADDNHFRDLDADAFAAKAAHFLADLNAIHPFREGNGRVQNVFLTILADQAGHPLDLQRLDPPAFLSAMVASFNGEEELLQGVIRALMRRAD